jgi:hypothetical protein
MTVINFDVTQLAQNRVDMSDQNESYIEDLPPDHLAQEEFGVVTLNSYSCRNYIAEDCSKKCSDPYRTARAISITHVYQT